MSDRPYQIHTATVQASLAGMCLLLALLSLWWDVGPWLGLLLSAATNAVIAAEKWKLLWRKPDG